jgi:hypothetical protein
MELTIWKIAKLLKKRNTKSRRRKRKIYSHNIIMSNNEANRLQQLPSSYSLLGLPDLSTQCNNKQAESKQKEEIREVYKGDIAE